MRMPMAQGFSATDGDKYRQAAKKNKRIHGQMRESRNRGIFDAYFHPFFSDLHNRNEHEVK
jgi:hypothetical protein